MGVWGRLRCRGVKRLHLDGSLIGGILWLSRNLTGDHSFPIAILAGTHTSDKRILLSLRMQNFAFTIAIHDPHPYALDMSGRRTGRGVDHRVPSSEVISQDEVDLAPPGQCE